MWVSWTTKVPRLFELYVLDSGEGPLHVSDRVDRPSNLGGGPSDTESPTEVRIDLVPTSGPGFVFGVICLPVSVPPSYFPSPTVCLWGARTT